MKNVVNISCVICDRNYEVSTSFPKAYDRQSVRGRWVCKDCKKVGTHEGRQKENRCSV